MSTASEPTSETEIVRQFVAGDQRVFHLLYEKYGERLRLFVHSRCRAEADDIVQKTWLKAWTARQRFDGSNFGAWLFTIARNIVCDHFRRGAMSSLPDDEILLSEQVTAAKRYERKEELDQLRRCCERLSPELRRVLQAILKGVSKREIAQSENIETATVYTRVHRATSQLRGCMEGKRS